MCVSVPNSKKVVCITGNVSTGRKSAPRRLLVRDGFVRPKWFTTDLEITDGDYRHLSMHSLNMAKLEKDVLVELPFAGGVVGILCRDFESAMTAARQGVLVVGPPEIAAQLAHKIPQTIVFAFEDAAMELPRHLDDLQTTGQLHRIDINVLSPGAWTDAYRSMMKVMGLGTRHVL